MSTQTPAEAIEELPTWEEVRFNLDGHGSHHTAELDCKRIRNLFLAPFAKLKAERNKWQRQYYAIAAEALHKLKGTN